VKSRKLSPEDIQSMGYEWPPPGFPMLSLSIDENDRIDLEQSLAYLRASLKLTESEGDGARWFASQAARPGGSFFDHEDFSDAAGAFETKAAEVRAAIELLEAIQRSARWRFWLNPRSQ
jgi:hypothetical protein